MRINKPFRILKDFIRFFKPANESNNILQLVREENITRELWNKALEKFLLESKPLPIYINHNHDEVVGSITKLEVRDDGLYVAEHSLNDKGLQIIDSKQYTMPSIDAVITKNDDGEIIDLELFGISLVNSAGATEIELVTMSKIKEKIKNNKESKMDKEELWALLEDDAILSEMPEETLQRIFEAKKDLISKLMEAETETVEQEKSESEDDEDTEEDEETSKSKGKGKEKGKGKGKGKDGTQTKDSEDEEEDDEDEDKETVAMSKFYDDVAYEEGENGGRATPRSLKTAERIIRKMVSTVGANKAVDIARKEVVFYGKQEVVFQGKNKSSNIGSIVSDILRT